MKEIETKHILNRNSHGDSWFGFDFNMNLYQGCCHGCIYCDTRSDCYRIENFDEVRIKKNALAILENELAKKRIKGQIIGTGAACDHYNPFEKDFKIMQRSLELIDKFKFGINIITKSDLVTRDTEILKRISAHSPVSVIFTITTADDNLCKIIEPNSPPSSKRFHAMKKLSDSGITTGILLTPTLPFINDTEENISALLETAAKSGAKYAFSYGFGVTLRDKQRDYYYKELDKYFPQLKQKYINTFGNTYSCNSPNSGRLLQLFIKKCGELNLVYEMKKIIEIIKNKNYCQLSFL